MTIAFYRPANFVFQPIVRLGDVIITSLQGRYPANYRQSPALIPSSYI